MSLRSHGDVTLYKLKHAECRRISIFFPKKHGSHVTRYYCSILPSTFLFLYTYHNVSGLPPSGNDPSRGGLRRHIIVPSPPQQNQTQIRTLLHIHITSLMLKIYLCTCHVHSTAPSTSSFTATRSTKPALGPPKLPLVKPARTNAKYNGAYVTSWFDVLRTAFKRGSFTFNKPARSWTVLAVGHPYLRAQ